MLRFRYDRKLKGSIAIYIMIWGMILLTITLLGLSLECEKKKNLYYIEKQLESTSITNKYREYLFSCLNRRMKENLPSFSQVNVDEFINDNYEILTFPSNSDITEFRNKCKLYVKEDKNIIFTYLDDEGNKRFECYKINIIEGKLKFCIIQNGFLPMGNEL
jgi:hypothetical protein